MRKQLLGRWYTHILFFGWFISVLYYVPPLLETDSLLLMLAVVSGMYTVGAVCIYLVLNLFSSSISTQTKPDTT